MTDQELQSLRNLGNQGEAAADEIDRLRAQVQAWETWQQEGDRILSRPGAPLFSLGVWWGERPWRKDREGN